LNGQAVLVFESWSKRTQMMVAQRQKITISFKRIRRRLEFAAFSGLGKIGRNTTDRINDYD
jgi:hypothetical protein